MTANRMIGKLENVLKPAEQAHEPNQEQRRLWKQMAGCVKGVQIQMKSVIHTIVQVSLIVN